MAEINKNMEVVNKYYSQEKLNKLVDKHLDLYYKDKERNVIDKKIAENKGRWSEEFIEEFRRRFEKWFREGFIEGFAKGFVQGMKEAAVTAAGNLLKEGVDVKLIMKITRLTQEEIDSMTVVGFE